MISEFLLKELKYNVECADKIIEVLDSMNTSFKDMNGTSYVTREESSKVMERVLLWRHRWKRGLERWEGQ